MNIRGFGVAWFVAEDWPKLLAVAADRATLPDTHAEFETIAGRKFDRLRTQGADIHKVAVSVDELVAFCKAHRKPVDAMGRATFAAFVMARRSRAN